MRAFVGILFDDETNNKIEKIIEFLKPLPIRCKFVEKENFHINLSFLGEINENLLNNYLNKLESISKKYKAFTIEIKDIMLIPNERFFRVIALNVFDENNLIETIAKEIGGEFKQAHLTLARVKEIYNKEIFLKKIKSQNFYVGKFAVEKFSLIESILERNGPKYKVIKEFYLQ